MAGITFTVEIDDLVARQRIGDLITRMENPAPFYGAVGEHLVNSAKSNFDQESAPDGTPWQPLRPSTLQRRLKSGSASSTILTVTKRLKASIIYQVEADGVRIGSPVPYAAIHQLGGTINKAARTGKAFGRENVSIPAHSISVPARPYLGVSTSDEAEILELAEAWLGEE